MNSLWFEKYRPKKLDDMLFDKSDIDKAKKWITDFTNKKNVSPCLFLYGKPGIGKTSLAYTLLKDNDYDICEFNASEVRNQKQIKDQLSEINGNVNVLDFMNNKKKKIAIIMDEIDGMNTNDRGGLSELIDIIFPKKKKEENNKSPFICISNSIDKKIKLLRDKSVYINCKCPSQYLITKLVKKILTAENIMIDEIAIIEIIKHSQNDIRRLINILEFLFYDKTKDVGDIYENIDKLILNFDKKNISYDIYNSVSSVLNNKHSYEQLEEYYNIDKTLFPLLIIENIPNYVTKNRSSSTEDKLKCLSNLYDNFSISDNIDRNIYLEQNWELNKYTFIQRCVTSNYYINQLDKYKLNKINNINYSSLINKTSLEYLNYRYTDFYNSHFINYSTSNITEIIANILILKFINNKDEAIKIISKNNFKFDDFEKKIKKFASKHILDLLSSEHKKKIKQYF